MLFPPCILLNLFFEPALLPLQLSYHHFRFNAMKSLLQKFRTRAVRLTENYAPLSAETI